MNIKLKKQSNKYKVYNGDQYLCSISVKDIEDDTIDYEEQLVAPIKKKLPQHTPQEIWDAIYKAHLKCKARCKE